VNPAATKQFQKQLGSGNVAHVLNDGATTTSTDNTAQGVINAFETTTTTDATQIGNGNGHVLSQFTTTSTTSTDHNVVNVHHNKHSSTTEFHTSTEASTPPAAAGRALCAGEPLSVILRERSADVPNKLCLHVKGSMVGDAFQVAAIKRPVIILQCTAGSANQLFTWLPIEEGGHLHHDASGLLVSVATDAVLDGSDVTLKPAALTDSPAQAWVWADAAGAGGTISSVADERFEITDSRVNQASNGGLPVHMWHLHTSLPTGMPNAAWYADCADK
jgi:hypothetical protein